MDAKRLPPLSGVVAIVLIFAGFIVAGNTPKGTTSAAKVVAFYGEHTAAQTTSGGLLSLGALLFLVFAATFAARFRSQQGQAALCLLGAGVLVVGLATYAGLSIAMADVAGHIDSSALQALNVLAGGAVFAFLLTVGTSAFLLGAAAMVFMGGLAEVARLVGRRVRGRGRDPESRTRRDARPHRPARFRRTRHLDTHRQRHPHDSGRHNLSYSRRATVTCASGLSLECRAEGTPSTTPPTPRRATPSPRR